MALGAAVGEAVLGRRIGHRAALWGALCGTLPDLDVLVPMGDPVADFTYHRSASHSLIVLTLVAPGIAWLIHRLPRVANPDFRQWWLMVFLALVTHPLLDSFTVYGTQIFWPLDPTPASWSSVFIIDPAYTLPLITGLLVTMMLARSREIRPWLPNAVGLLLSTLYLGWSQVAKLEVEADTRQALADQGISYERILSTPAPFTTLLWRVVVMTPDRYYEGFDSLVDGTDTITFHDFPTRPELLDGIENDWRVQRLQWFTHGFYSVGLRDDEDVVLTDLRMGVEPTYIFSFRLGTQSNPHTRPAPTRQIGARFDMARLGNLWDRIWSPDTDMRPRVRGLP